MAGKGLEKENQVKKGQKKRRKENWSKQEENIRRRWACWLRTSPAWGSEK